MLDFEVASFSSLRSIQRNHFVMAAETASEAEADIDDIIERKRIRGLLKQDAHQLLFAGKMPRR